MKTIKKECPHHSNTNEAKDKFWKAPWTSKCTCENFQQNEDCEHIGNKVLEEVGLGVGDKDCPDCKVDIGCDKHYIKDGDRHDRLKDHEHDGGDDAGRVDCLKCEKQMLKHLTPPRVDNINK